jgi:hypothetical protein
MAGWMPSEAQAAPWEKLLTFNQVEADPNKDYRLTEQNGPWTILACSFSGPEARRQAHELVIEIRKRYKLPAYLYEKQFEFGEDVAGRGVDRYGGQVRMRYRRGSEISEIAVMVGDYQNVDDPDAQATLERLKYYRPDCLAVDRSKPTAQNLAGLRTIQRMILAPGNDKKKKGPMSKAFLTTNPLLPKEYFAPKGIDEFVVRMNEGRKHSLLQCPGKYTVQVAHFTGQVVMDQGEIRAVNEGRRQLQGRLAEAAEKAERLTEALRMKGYEAYVFHDRYASVVTVGSFDSVGTHRADGRIEINPKIHAIMKTFGVDQKSALGNPHNMLKQKELAGIRFDPQPLPVEVPRQSISSDYAHEVAKR